VPQAALGGQAMTMTCPRCNSGLGSRIEAELHDWFDQARIDVSFDHEAVQGRRRGPRLLYREGSNGFCLIAEADVVPEIRQMLNAGALQMHYRMPDPRRYRLAALKHAYLPPAFTWVTYQTFQKHNRYGPICWLSVTRQSGQYRRKANMPKGCPSTVLASRHKAHL
jgi:hypothetical protein